MTNPNTHIPAQESGFHSAVISILTTALVVLAGFVTFAQFANV